MSYRQRLNALRAALTDAGVLPTDGTKQCPVCGEDIKVSARKCVRCQSWLNWRRVFDWVGGTNLALVTALVAVVTTAAPVMRSLLQYPDSRITAVYAGFGTRALNGDVLVLVRNSGAKPGAVTAAQFLVLWNGTNEISIDLTLPDKDPVLIDSNQTVGISLNLGSTAKLGPQTSRDEARRLTLPDASGDAHNSELAKAVCAVHLWVQNAGGSEAQIAAVTTNCIATYPAISEAVADLNREN
jgi:hypothetical protein